MTTDYWLLASNYKLLNTDYWLRPTAIEYWYWHIVATESRLLHTTDYRPPTTDYWLLCCLLTTNYHLLTTWLFWLSVTDHRLSDYRLSIAEYWVPTTDCWPTPTGHRPLATDYWLLITDYRLPTTDCWLLITEYRLPTIDYINLTTEYRVLLLLLLLLLGLLLWNSL